MLNAQELRIGNYIKYEDGSVEHVSELVLTADHHLINDMTGAYSPLPLTKDLLVKLGFTLTGVSFATLYTSPDSRIVIKFEGVDETPVFFQGVCIAWVKYVHQLQNLYFALTGEELTLK
jgi:hypothetical protein